MMFVLLLSLVKHSHMHVDGGMVLIRAFYAYRSYHCR